MRRRGGARNLVAGAIPNGLSSLLSPWAALAPALPLGMIVLAIALWLPLADFTAAHHVLGRPSYSLNEDSNTPPSMQAEVRVGDYLVTYMIFPAFPRPGAPGRINLYAVRVDDGKPFQGEVTFRVRVDPWYSWLGFKGDEVRLGVRPPDDNVFRQGFLFREAGAYIISAEFEAHGEPYIVDFPLRVGAPPRVGPIGLVVGVLLAAPLAVTVIYRRRSMTAKIRASREGRG